MTNKFDPRLDPEHSHENIPDVEADSPDFLAPPGRGKGVRRLNKKPMLVVMGIILAAFLGVTYTFMQRQAANNAPVATGPVAPINVTNSPPVRPVGGDYVAPPIQTGDASIEPTLSDVPSVSTPTVQAAPPPPSEAYMNRMRLIERLEEKRLSDLEAALGAAGSVQVERVGAVAQQGQPNALGNESPMQQYLAAAAAQSAGAAQGGIESGGFGGGGGGESMRAANGQDGKRAFLSGTPESDVYLNAQRTVAVAPKQELKAGAVIPGVMISGINSDLPGQIIGQVRENVYDSATGENLLIPAGSRLVGTYDSGVTFGQERALIAWNRIIYPDSSSISLAKMPGADMGGYAGFTDQVNNHYGKIFTSAILLSTFSAGVQLSQPQAANGDNISADQTIAAALGQQLGQLGMQLAQRNMNIQPTLEIRPGYQFNVMVTKDIILPTWEGHPSARK